MSDYDHILILGFGGPEHAADVPEFLSRVTGGRGIPEARIQEVQHHYELIGGVSPYNEEAFKLQKNLREVLSESGLDLPVFLGMRYWKPFLADEIQAIKEQGFKKGLAVITAPFRSPASCYRYKENLNRVLEETGADIFYEYLTPWYDDQEFIDIQTAALSRVLGELSSEDTHVIFCVHSIPTKMISACSKCAYDKEFEFSVKSTMQSFQGWSYELAYQSRSGNPRDPWLEPDVLDATAALDSKKVKHVVLVPIGFPLNNVEILFDLDYELKLDLESRGFSYHRAETVGTKKEFAEFIANKLTAQISVNT